MIQFVLLYFSNKINVAKEEYNEQNIARSKERNNRYSI